MTYIGILGEICYISTVVTLDPLSQKNRLSYVCVYLSINLYQNIKIMYCNALRESNISYVEWEIFLCEYLCWTNIRFRV